MKLEKNTLMLSDCLLVLKELYESGQKDLFDLIYIDPPFNSRREFNLLFESGLDSAEKAFNDTWNNETYIKELNDISELSPELYEFLSLIENLKEPQSYISYLTFISIRCWYMHKLLKPTGSFYFHCDDKMSAHVKLLLNIIFGYNNFRSKICWQRNFSPGSGRKFQAKKYSRNVDFIFYYTKSKDYYFNWV